MPHPILFVLSTCWMLFIFVFDTTNIMLQIHNKWMVACCNYICPVWSFRNPQQVRNLILIRYISVKFYICICLSM